MAKEKMVHYNPNTGKVEKCGAKQGKCPFGNENHFPEGNIKDPIDKKVEQIRDLKTLIDNTGEEVNKINWNNIRIEDNEIICGEDWKLYDLTADNPTQGIRSGINSVPEDVRRKVFDITEEYFKEKKYIFNNE